MNKTNNILSNSFFYLTLLLLPNTCYSSQFSIKETSSEAVGESTTEDILSIIRDNRDLNNSLFKKKKKNEIFKKSIDELDSIILEKNQILSDLEKSISLLKKEINDVNKEKNNYVIKSTNLNLKMKKHSTEIHRRNEKLTVFKKNTKESFLVAIIKFHINKNNKSILENVSEKIGGLDNAFEKIFIEVVNDNVLCDNKFTLIRLLLSISKSEEVIYKEYNNGTNIFDVQLGKVAESIINNHMLKKN